MERYAQPGSKAAPIAAGPDGTLLLKRNAPKRLKSYGIAAVAVGLVDACDLAAPRCIQPGAGAFSTDIFWTLNVHCLRKLTNGIVTLEEIKKFSTFGYARCGCRTLDANSSQKPGSPQI